MSELNVKVGRGTDVVGLCRVQLVQERAHVVPVYVCIGFDEDIPFRILSAFPRLQEHGQELVLVEIPAICSLFQCPRIFVESSVLL